MGHRETPGNAILSREVPIDPAHAALLFIDVQNYSLPPAAGGTGNDGDYFRRAVAEVALPNMQLLQQACRAAGIEVLYTVIESLTRDGRDRSLDYKISGLHVPRGGAGARMADAIRPADDEMVLPKTSSSPFMSTNLDYVLRNLGVRSLIVAGLLTDQCVDSTVRDACDLGYLVTVPTDACATHSQERHDWSLRNNRGYCRQVVTAALVAEIAAVSGEEDRIPGK
jgi:ureidoacrylate peracid hydrolase